MNWCLLVSPWETLSGQWELFQFPTEHEAQAAATARDLTREYYVVPVREIARIIGEWFDRQESA